MTDPRTSTEEHALFYGCPECPASRGPDDIYNAGKAHRAACHTHRTSWFIGSNLLGVWKYETEQEQRERYREIEGYGDVTRPSVRRRRKDLDASNEAA